MLILSGQSGGFPLDSHRESASPLYHKNPAEAKEKSLDFFEQLRQNIYLPVFLLWRVKTCLKITPPKLTAIFLKSEKIRGYGLWY
jgi:hypothetical protein